MRLIKQVLIAIAFTQMFGCGSIHKTTRSLKRQTLSLDGSRTFKDCAEVVDYVRAANERLQAPGGGSVVAKAMPSAAGDSINADGQTNLQEVGVDEADVVKITKDAIFVLRSSDIVVIDRSTQTERGVLAINSSGSANFYVTEDKLIIVADNSESSTVSVKFYDLKSSAMPALVSTVSVPGSLRESRVQDGRAVLILSNFIPEKFDENSPDLAGARCERTVVPYLTGATENSFLPTSLTTIHTLDIDSNGSMRSALNILDETHQVYASSGHVFIAKSGYLSEEKTHIRKIDLDAVTGEISLGAVGLVEGYVKDKWAFKYYEDRRALAVASTGSRNEQGNFHLTNYLQILTQEGATLNLAGRLEGFGLNEDIRAVRYMGNLAYVVTFKKTDPLFAIDLSDLSSPRMIGELEIPGFSTMLHPLGKGQMLGVGFDAQDMGSFAWFQGIQVSLFDVSKPENPTRLDVKINGARGSSSEATFDHHALFYDSDARIVGLPMNVFGDASTHNESQLGEFKSSGSVFYKITDGHLNELARISHSDLMSSECREALRDPNQWWSNEQTSLDVRRIVMLDGSILTISPFGIKVYDRNLTKMSQRVVFSHEDIKCEKRRTAGCY